MISCSGQIRKRNSDPHLSTRQGLSTLESGLVDSDMELAQSNGKMVLLIKVNGLKARLMGTADLYSQMVTNTWEATKMTKLMAGESCTKMTLT